MTSIKEFIEKISAEGKYGGFILRYQVYLEKTEELKNPNLSRSEFDGILVEKMMMRGYLEGHLSALYENNHLDGMSEYLRLIESLYKEGEST